MASSTHADSCSCVNDTSSTESLLSPNCVCPRDERDIVVHEETCLLYKNEKIVFVKDPKTCVCDTPPSDAKEGICPCCSCAVDRCTCRKSGREALDEWRNKPLVAGALPPVLDANHPLMQKFQEALRQFLLKENAIADEEIMNLREELRLKKEAYNRDLEAIYRSDHDTNQQRVLIEEYEQTLAQKRLEREEAEYRAKESAEKHKKAKEKYEQDLINERETNEELEALTMLCRQMEQWREDTESELTISHRMSDKMRAEKRALADEKRQLDMIIYSLNNEVWKLESKLELFKKQMEIKQSEMDKVNDRVTSYATELEDLELDKRRLVSLWNSVLVNIQQRDKVYDSVREDYKKLQENYTTLLNNLEITKKVTEEEMNKGKELAMNRDKIVYDTNAIAKQYDAEDAKRLSLEEQIAAATESIEMSERDENLIRLENQTMMNILKSTEKECDRRTMQKLKLENDILANLQDCLLNDKAVEAMANGIKKMRELSRKQEISLMEMENQHAKIMFDIEVYRNRQARNNKLSNETLDKVQAKEKAIDDLEEKFQQGILDITKKTRELDMVNKKYAALKEIFDSKSPQERRVEELEQQIKALRERTEELQREWLMMQGHVVKLSAHHQKLVADVNLIKKQIQICDQKTMRIQAEADNITSERARVDRSLRDLQGRLELLERNRKDATERNQNAQHTNLAITHEYSANLKDAEMDIIKLEDDIENTEQEKMNLTQELDRIQRQALIWQRKGIQAVEVKKNMAAAKSAAGEIGQMRAEIHRMTVRREQLRKIGEKLADDLAQCVTRRELVMEKSRAAAALEKAHGPTTSTSQSQYRHKLRLAKADVARVKKDIAETKSRMDEIERDQERLENEMNTTSKINAKLEEQIAKLMRESSEAERQKQWLLERVVRSQRLGAELSTAIKKQSLNMKKPKSAIIEEYAQSRILNDTLRNIVDTLAREYPYLEDKLAAVANTLTIYIPEDVPQLSEEECICFMEEESMSRSQEEFAKMCEAEKPLEK